MQPAALRSTIRKEINRLTREQLQAIADTVQALRVSEHFVDPFRSQLLKYIQKTHLSDKDKIKLRELLKQKWAEIKKNKSLTWAFVDYFRSFWKNNDTLLVKRVNKDGRVGYAFEEKFFNLLLLYLQSKKELCNLKGKFLFNLKYNEYVSIPGIVNKQKPDILITLKSLPIYFIELKKSFTSATLKRDYYKKLGHAEKFEGVGFLYLIFSAGKSKIKVYKKCEKAKVICYNLEERNNTSPSVCDTIEDAFEEIALFLKQSIKLSKDGKRS